MDFIAARNEEYKSKDYWDRRFEQEDEYEWLVQFNDVRHTLETLLQSEHRILVVGCGNSRFSADLYDAGFRNIVNIDYSEVVIHKMSELNADRCEMRWDVMDMTQLTFGDAFFDVVIDKAAMDAIMVDEGDVWYPEQAVIDTAHKMCKEIARVLIPQGLHIQISFAQPHFRTKYLMGLRFLGDVTDHFRVSEGHSSVYPWTLSVSTIASSKGLLDNFMYIMRKDG